MIYKTYSNVGSNMHFGLFFPFSSEKLLCSQYTYTALPFVKILKIQVKWLTTC